MAMMKAIGIGALAVLCLSACDRQDERKQRAGTLYEGTRKQIATDVLGQDIRTRPMEEVSLADRALRGRLLTEDEIGPRVAPQASRFAVGSIVAKPVEIELLEEAAVIEAAPEAVVLESVEIEDIEPIDPELTTEELVELEIPEAMRDRVRETLSRRPEAAEKLRRIELPTDRVVRVEQRPGVVLRPLGEVRDRSVAAPTPTPNLPEQRILKMERRVALDRPRERIQVAARSRMLDAADRYGLSVEIQPSTGGQMVLQLGEDGIAPRRYQDDGTPPRLDADLPRLAIERRDLGCATADLEAIRADQELATICVIEDLRSSGEFEYVEKDYIFEHQFARRPRNDEDDAPVAPVIAGPNDPLYELQWHYFTNGDGEDQSPGGAGFFDYWDGGTRTGSTDVIVAIVDTGLQMSHPDIDGNDNILPGYDFVSDPRMGNDGDGRDADANDPGDMCPPRVPEDTFHGTHVAGVVGAAATGNQRGVAGGAWNVSIVPVRAMGRCGGRLSDITDSIRWAGGLIPAEENGVDVWNDNPADIINLSLGLYESCPAALQDAIDAVTERGVIVVAAAGNAYASTKNYAPGGCNNVISVAAGDARGQITPYSNFGSEVDILAPGGDLQRDDDGDGFPDGVLSTKTASNCIDPVTGTAQANCDYAFEQGTSMAAPHVAAALALIQSNEPELAPSAVIDRLLSATETRSPQQCAGSCAAYPGTTSLGDDSGLCARPCGVGLLNLAKIAEDD